MTPVELERLEAIVDEARKLRQRLHSIETLRSCLLEMHGPQSPNIWKALRVEMRQGDCVLRFHDSSNSFREHTITLSVEDGIDVVEALLACIKRQHSTLQKKLEELKL